MLKPCLGAALAFLALQCSAASIGVVGLFPGKAILVVDDNQPTAYSVDSDITPDIRLIAADRDSATILQNGKRSVLILGQYVHHSAANSNPTVTLQAGADGHFMAQCQVNQAGSVSMLVDTGASMIVIPGAQAQRLGINYKQGQQVNISTANGVSSAYQVRLDTIKLGDIILHQVDALVQEQGLPIALLGMSFLRQLSMKRENDQMVLTQH